MTEFLDKIEDAAGESIFIALLDANDISYLVIDELRALGVEAPANFDEVIERLVSSLSVFGDAVLAVRDLEPKLGLQFFEGDTLATEIHFFCSAIAHADAADLDNLAEVQSARAKMAAKMSKAAKAAKAFLAALGELLA